jgi:spore germination protein YaaH
MSRLPRSVHLLLIAVLAVEVVVGHPFGSSPTAPDASSASWPVPATLPDGPVRLPDGRLLPPAPAGYGSQPSMPAILEEAHASDPVAFEPGERPTVPLTGALPASGWQDPAVAPLGLANSAVGRAADLTALPNGLRREVLGFLPYWMLDPDELKWMQYQLVSTIAYFGVAARSDGTLATSSVGWNGWLSSAMTGVINAAHARGVRVVLTVTMMAYDGGAQQATLLGSATYRARLVDAIVAAVRARGADGVNLDFEPVAVAQRSQYTSFVRQLKAALIAAGVGSHLTVCTMAGAATWATGYDLAGLVAAGAADAVFVMGYDFSWSGSARAGGVAPMESPYILDVNESIGDYLQVIPASKIIWGVPYYGRTWLTQSSALNALTRPGSSGSSAAYYYPANLSYAATHGRLWDPVGRVPWFRYWNSTVGSWVQGYYDDATSLAFKWDMVNQHGLLGTGMWALLMDAGRQELWNLIASKFVNDTAPPTGGIGSLPPLTDASAIRVTWRAIDVGSGLLSYSVQVRDRAGGSWTSWLTDTTQTSATWLGQPGHTYEFRVSAVDRRGNRQAWVGSPANPGAALVVGGFATVMVDALNVRAGAGTGFATQATLTRGSRVFLAGGPIISGGMNWYQVYHGFTEWPPADYPRVGWAAAGPAGDPYLVPAVAPAITTMSPTVAGLAAAPMRFSPNGDGVLDGVEVAFTIPAAASAAQLKVVNAAGSVVATRDLGPLGAGSHQVAWDGRLAGGAWAPAGTYVPRIELTDAAGTHVGPAGWVDPTILGRWGVTADLTAPSVAASSPVGSLVAVGAVVSATFNEPVGSAGAYLSLTEVATGNPVNGTVSYDPTTRRATLDPAVDLAPATAYRVDVAPAIRDAAGNSLAASSWTFTTAPVGLIGFNPPRQMTFLSGAHTGFRFDAAGLVTATRTATLAAPSGAATSLRSTVIPGQPGPWLLVDNGIWAGYWIRESTRAYVPGEVDRVTFAGPRLVSFAIGTHTGYRFTATGAVSASKTATLGNSSSAQASARAVINGRPHLLIANGIWAGYWVPESSRIILR